MSRTAYRNGINRQQAAPPSTSQEALSRGLAHYQAGQFAEAALDSFEQSLKLRPDHVETLLNVGELLRELGRPDEAEPHLRRALKLQPVYPAALSPLLGILLDQKRADEADDLSRRMLALE